VIGDVNFRLLHAFVGSDTLSVLLFICNGSVTFVCVADFAIRWYGGTSAIIAKCIA
jgi:hypothetical protein